MKPTRIHSLSPQDALSVILRLPRFARLDAAGCLVWSGCRDHSGYGKMTTGRIRTGAHRLAWLAIKGDIPGDLVVDHLCRNRACVNVTHMELVTNAENTLRGDHSGKLGRSGRRRGGLSGCGRHGFSDGYVASPRDGYYRWVCRVCARAAKQRFNARQADQGSLRALFAPSGPVTLGHMGGTTCPIPPDLAVSVGSSNLPGVAVVRARPNAVG